FLEQPDSAGDSPILRREAVRRALQRIDGCDFNHVVDSRGLRTAGVSFLALGIAAALLLFFYPTQAWTALARLADPFGVHDWPKQTLLELDPPRTRIGRNEAYEVKGRVRGVIPEKASIVYRLEGSTPIEQVMPIVPD